MKVLQIGKNTALELLHEGCISGHRTRCGWRIFKEDVIEYLRHS
jgi:excisionase family DNA binding protein